MTTATTKIACYKGRYHRIIGRAFNSKGKLAQKKFLLGTDEARAQELSARLEQLWQEVVAERKQTLSWMERIGGRLADVDLVTGTAYGMRRAKLNWGPYWREEVLAIAEAVRRGDRHVAVDLVEDESPDKYVQRVAALTETYSVVEFVPADATTYARGREILADQAQDHVDHARGQAAILATLANRPAPDIGPSLSEAVEAYVATLPTTDYGRVETANARRIAASSDDIPLGRLDYAALEKIADYWRSRPPSQAPGAGNRPISVHTVVTHLKTMRRLIRWIERQEAYRWSPPRHWAEALKADPRKLRTSAERSRMARGVETWTVEELAVLYRESDAQRRLLMLLGLNLGFAQAEATSLRIGEIDRSGERATVKRIRHKSSVYAEWPLWDETLQALDQHLAGRRGREGADDLVLLTTDNRPWIRQRIANRWNSLLTRVQKEKSDFRRLPFKALRKTAAQMVREVAGGETASVFLAHGRPTDDELLSDYSRPDFEKVAAALDQVHGRLAPMFARS